MPSEHLRRRHEERDRLLQRVRLVVEGDARVRAAWLFGSCARGDTDALSDLDVAVVVRDDAVAAVAGAPERPETYRHVLGSPRGRWVAQVSEPLLLLEGPQNAVPGGAFLASFFVGQAGPQEIDWLWVPQSSARLPTESLLLLDRDGVPCETGETELRPLGPVSDRTPFEVAAHAVPWFWATLLWNAKYAARSPHDTHMLMLGATVRAVGNVLCFLDPDADAVGGEPVPEHPEDRLRILRDLANRMEPLMSRAPMLAAGISPDVVPQVHRYLRLADDIMRHHA